MKIQINDAMTEATSVGEMADAFHPSEMNADGGPSHVSSVIDAIEAALLYGARRISQAEFLSAIDDLEWQEVS